MSTFGYLSSRGSLPCGHSQFCLTCIHRWAHNTNKCPLCNLRFHQVQELVQSYPTGLVLQLQDCDPAPQDNSELRAIERISCYLCGSGESWDSMLLCDYCDRGVHIQCLGMSRLPQSQLWFCDQCLETMDLRTQVDQWREMEQLGRRSRTRLLLLIQETTGRPRFSGAKIVEMGQNPGRRRAYR